MKKSTKLGLVALGGLAGAAAVMAVALYEEDQDQTVSRFSGKMADQAQKGLAAANDFSQTQAGRAGEYVATHWQHLPAGVREWLENRMS